MSENEESGEKQFDASDRRLEEARARGELARSPDLVAAASYGGFLLAALYAGGPALRAAGDAGAQLLSSSDRLAPQMMAQGAAPLATLLLEFGLALAPFFLFPALAAFSTLLALQTIVFTPDKLAPKLNRLSPLQGLMTKFGRSGLFEFGKSLVKLLVIAGILGQFLFRRSDDILGSVHLAPAISTVVLLQLLVAFLSLVVLIAVVIGALDYLWQRQEHLRRHRMSRQDMLDEVKGSEGDPAMKAQRRQRGQEIATNRMLADVPKADVVVVNPTHYAVALKWSRGDQRAPICLAKGVDEIALRIREKAIASGVPLHHDPETARALYASVKVGEQIRPTQYRAVAAAIRFAEAMRARAGVAR
ncbi:flagellar biosynthesis protein FlhB [Fertoebacter nigrum]|uniref:Flagellar biosynthesis protein FlhB n=1 Tax=Fertoeibacter niger TaxID=2656921 RepID=A0A8X8GWW6_9RHOB|nr:flagellar type III secretion system protein FlhB [Fertoeibacter niger]NUB44607.1 flagellar biosynthesis protein FlhB [Fertoeibacter niger]